MITQKITSTIVVNGKKYEYSLKKIDENTTYVECKSAKISQPFDNEDLAELLFYLPDYISEHEIARQKADAIQFRVNKEEKFKIAQRAQEGGFSSMSDYLRSVALG